MAFPSAVYDKRRLGGFSASRTSSNGGDHVGGFSCDQLLAAAVLHTHQSRRDKRAAERWTKGSRLLYSHYSGPLCFKIFPKLCIVLFTPIGTHGTSWKQTALLSHAAVIISGTLHNLIVMRLKCLAEFSCRGLEDSTMNRSHPLSRARLSCTSVLEPLCSTWATLVQRQSSMLDGTSPILSI